MDILNIHNLYISLYKLFLLDPYQFSYSVLMGSNIKMEEQITHFSHTNFFLNN